MKTWLLIGAAATVGYLHHMGKKRVGRICSSSGPGSRDDLARYRCLDIGFVETLRLGIDEHKKVPLR